MTLHTNDVVNVKMRTGTRPAVVLDFKWNLALVRFKDGDCECEWVEQKLITSY